VLCLMYLHLKAVTLSPELPAYNLSWWLNTFPVLTDEQMVSLYRMRRTTFDWILTRMMAAAPAESNGESHIHKLELLNRVSWPVPPSTLSTGWPSAISPVWSIVFRHYDQCRGPW